MKITFAAAALPWIALGLAPGLNAAIRTAAVDYSDGNTPLEGYTAYDDAVKGKRPGIIVFHEWTGLGPYEIGRAKQLAGLGYVVLAADVYGKGIRPSTPEDAGKEAGKYRKDRALLRSRANAALRQLLTMPQVDPGRTAAIGYCFGGGAALELARSGAALRGVASFHGNLDTPSPEDARNIKARIIAFHGADDPFVSSAAVTAFQDEMRGGGTDWQLVMYGGAVHRFTNPAAGGDVKSGAAYNETADRRSWRALMDFFAEIFKK